MRVRLSKNQISALLLGSSVTVTTGQNFNDYVEISFEENPKPLRVTLGAKETGTLLKGDVIEIREGLINVNINCAVPLLSLSEEEKTAIRIGRETIKAMLSKFATVRARND